MRIGIAVTAEEYNRAHDGVPGVILYTAGESPGAIYFGLSQAPNDMGLYYWSSEDGLSWKCLMWMMISTLFYLNFAAACDKVTAIKTVAVNAGGTLNEVGDELTLDAGTTGMVTAISLHDAGTGYTGRRCYHADRCCGNGLHGKGADDHRRGYNGADRHD
jgi:hypothetical protein